MLVCVKTVRKQCFLLNYMVVPGAMLFPGTSEHNFTESCGCERYEHFHSLVCSCLTDSFLDVLAVLPTSVDSKEIQLETELRVH